MTVTASRLKGTPLTLDWTGLEQAGVRHALDLAHAESSWKRLKKRFQDGEVGFYDAPLQEELSQLHASSTLAQAILQSGRFTDILFLGIGGSSLGPISLLSALQSRSRAEPRLQFVENPDPEHWAHVVSGLKAEKTVVVVITKSGTTLETMGLMMSAMNWLGKPRWQEQLIALTDPTQGDLRALVKQLNLKNLPIAPSIGGRFSIFSSVGVFPAALAGLDVAKFLKGAQSVRDYFEKTTIEHNPFFRISTQLIAEFKKRPIHVCMPYSTFLRQIGNWFVQLWAESLGKDGKGFTPIASIGANDQHSLLQLLRDGPDDKVTFFIEVDHKDQTEKLVRPDLPSTLRLGSFHLLAGHSLGVLLQTELQATRQVLAGRKRPQLLLSLDQLDEYNLGALYFAFATWTAVVGSLWDLNAFDQPGVQEGKTYTVERLQSLRET